jgi:hypothetical protein
MCSRPETKLTAEQQLQIGNLFHQKLGQCVASWSFVESSLCTYFTRLTQMHPVTARRIFYSATGFDARAKMLIAAIGSVKTEPDISAFLNKIVGKARNYAGSRNAIMHGDVMFVGFEGSKHYGQYIILQGRQHWHADPPDSDVITLENLNMAAENFGRLAACILVSLNWDGKTAEKSPLRLIELIEKLPKEAHLSRLDPRIVAQFPIEKEDVPHVWR